MKSFILILITLCRSFISAPAQFGAKHVQSIEDNEYTVAYQAFTFHDETGTQHDTVRNKGDFIIFCRDGNAYMKHKGVLDSIRYYIDSSSICFGDTPFFVTLFTNGDVLMHQHESGKSGDYNEVTYFLTERHRQKRGK